MTQALTMRIRMNVDGVPIAATLHDNETARDFISLLPLTLTLSDYASAEKISDLPRRLSTKGAPAGTDAAVGDIAYYAPWGNLAVFYRASGYARGLVKLGAIDSDVAVLRGPGQLTTKIEHIEG